MQTCERIRESLSARQDGEAVDTDLTAIAAHLPGCAACRAHEQALARVARRTRVAGAAPVPDLSAAIVRDTADVVAGEASRRSERRSQLRAVLALAGVVQVVLAATTLLGTGVHGLRDLAAFELALGLSFVVTAARPRYADGLGPFVALIAAVSLVVGLVELVTGQAALLAELAHLLPVAVVPVVRGLAQSERPAPRALVHD